MLTLCTGNYGLCVFWFLMVGVGGFGVCGCFAIVRGGGLLLRCWVWVFSWHFDLLRGWYNIGLRGLE